MKKGHLAEQTLRHHLQALQELPAGVIVHPTLVVTTKSGAAILKRACTHLPAASLRGALPGQDAVEAIGEELTVALAERSRTADESPG